jgi:hypothetical protein
LHVHAIRVEFGFAEFRAQISYRNHGKVESLSGIDFAYEAVSEMKLRIGRFCVVAHLVSTTCHLHSNKGYTSGLRTSKWGRVSMNVNVIKCGLFTSIIGLCLLLSLPLRSQVAGGSLSGIITDRSGASVPNANVVIKNSATGIARSVTTNAEGFYTAANLLPGNYEVAVSAAGFNTEVKKQIVINVGSQPVFNLVLEIGVVVNQVEVTTEAPAVELAS